MEFLRKNAEYFEKKAREAFEEGEYSFALYFADQALQLYLKYIMAKEVGDYPKTHSFPTLFNALGRVTQEASNFYSENADILDLLEDAYLAVRYLGREYSAKSAEEALNLLKKFKEVFNGWLSSSR